MTKWYWPTWADWLRVYNGPVTNFANNGYGNQNIYWTILDKIDMFTPDDHLVIMWAENHRINLWYDKNWIDENDVEGFFPTSDGKLWYTKDVPYVGLYRTHPEFYTSFTHMIIDELQTILHTQLILNKIGCSYVMHSSKNLWTDGRPKFLPKYQQMWHTKHNISTDEIKLAKDIMALDPIKNLMQLIDWTKFIDSPVDLFNPTQYSGIWEYYINNKEYVMLKHETDSHPNSLAHHDYALEKVLKVNPAQGKYRNIAKHIASETITMHIPSLNGSDYIISADTELLNQKYKDLLETL